MVVLNLRVSNRGELTRGGPPTLELVEGLTTHHHKEQLVTKFYTGPRTWTDALGRPRQIIIDLRRIIYYWWTLNTALRDRWYDIIVLSVHASTEGKADDTKDSFYNDLERVLDQLPQHHTKILLGNLNAKIERKKFPN
jgi:hypothetical protein